MQGGALTATGEILPESMSLSLGERDSSASVTEAADAPDRAVGAWVRDPEGRVWRIRSVELNPVTRTRTIQLETILKTLEDRIIPAEKGPADMGGNANGCSCRQAFGFILGYQSDWKLGAVEYTENQPYQFNGDTLMSAMESVTETLDGAVWDVSMAAYPFTINIRKAATEPSCEMRISRNIQSLRRTIDRSRMYTVFYPIGKDDLRIGAVRKNDGTYGVKEHTETDAELDTEAKLRSWAKRKLRRHAMPAVSVSISGLDLSRATGEPMDRLRIGTVCRVPLPEYGTTISERITKISYSDVIREPERCTVTLANELADTRSFKGIAEAVSAAAASAARGGRSRAKKDGEDHAWLMDDKDKIGLIAEAVGGPGASKDWSRVSSIVVDGKGIHQKVLETNGELSQAWSSIEANEKAINLEVKNRTKGEGELSGRIDVEAGRIDQVVEAVGEDGTVTAASIVMAINNDTSLIRLTADHIAMDGTTSLAQVMTVSSGGVLFRSGAVTAMHGIIFAGASRSYQLDGYVIPNMVSWVEKRNGGKTLHLERFNGTSVDFSRATKLSGAFSGNRVTVTADDSTVPSWSRGFVKGSPSWDGSAYKLPIMHYQTDPMRPDGTACTVDVTGIYNEGKSDQKADDKSAPRYNCANNLTFLAAPDKLSSQPSTLYYLRNGTYYSLGTGYWYMRDGYMQTTTLYRIS